MPNHQDIESKMFTKCFSFLFGSEFEESDSTGPARQPAPVAASGAAGPFLTEHAERLSQLCRSTADL